MKLINLPHKEEQLTEFNLVGDELKVIKTDNIASPAPEPIAGVGKNLVNMFLVFQYNI